LSVNITFNDLYDFPMEMDALALVRIRVSSQIIERYILRGRLELVI